jgi:hypothetical protein
MMMNHGVADGLSDQELSQAVKGQGSVPGWLALSVLNSRNNARASAPVQPPSSSVADGVVQKALGQAGMQPQMQQPQQQSQPQGQGITSQAPQSFAKGGIYSQAPGITSANQAQVGYGNDLPQIQGFKWPGSKPYTTPLSGQDESKFRNWIAGQDVDFNPNDPKSDYDMRGFWKDKVKDSPSGPISGTQMKSDGMHFPDTYKTPYHQSASNESIYMPSDAPQWQGTDDSGYKLIDKGGNTVFDESNIKTLSPQNKSKGGILSLAGGTTPQNQSYQDSLTPNYTPEVGGNVNFTPSYAPTQADMTPQGAMDVQQGMYGESPDYKGQIDKLNAANQKSQVPMTGWGAVGRNISTIAANILANPSDPVGGFGKGLLARNADDEKLRQQNYANALKASEGTEKITDDQQKRAQAIAGSADTYMEAARTQADNNARAKALVDTGNIDRAKDVLKDNNALETQRAAAQDRILKNTGDRATRNVMISQMDPKDPQRAALQGITDTEDKQKQATEQATSDIEQHRESALQAQRASDQIKAQANAAGLARETQRQKAQMDASAASGMGPDGNVNETPDLIKNIALGNAPEPNQRAKNYTQVMTQAYNYSKANGLDFTPGSYAAKQNFRIGKIGTALNNFDTAVPHLEELQKASDKEGLNPMGSWNPSSAYSGLKTAAQIAGGETAKTIVGGQPGVTETQAYDKLLSGSLKGQRDEAIKTIYDNMGSRFGSYAQQYNTATHQVMDPDEFMHPETLQMMQAHGQNPYSLALPNGRSKHPSQAVVDIALKASNGDPTATKKLLKDKNYNF